MRTYHIEIEMRITTTPPGAFTDKTIASASVKQAMTCSAMDVHVHCTAIAKQAMDNMSTSVQTGLVGLIESERNCCSPTPA